jgi:hypothetical protein
VLVASFGVSSPGACQGSVCLSTEVSDPRSAPPLLRFADELCDRNGKPDLYNETINWAYMLLIRERIARTAQHEEWSRFAAYNQHLLNWKDSVLKKYYKDETLTSGLAKSTFVFPDKLTTQLGKAD